MDAAAQNANRLNLQATMFNIATAVWNQRRGDTPAGPSSGTDTSSGEHGNLTKDFQTYCRDLSLDELKKVRLKLAQAFLGEISDRIAQGQLLQGRSVDTKVEPSGA